MAVQQAVERDVYFKPRRIGHTNLWVDDLKRSEKFYNEVCGFHVEFWEPDLVATFLGTGNTPHDVGMIEVTGGKARYGRDGLLQLPEGIGFEPGLNHLAWELENEADLVAAIKRVEQDEIPSIMTVDHQVAHSIYLPDPDGNQIEFYCDTIKDWRSMLQGEQSLITGHWVPGEETPFTDGRYDDDPDIKVVDKAAIHPRRITHAVLESADVEGMVDYYAGVGGMDPVYEATDGSLTCLRGSHKAYRFHLAICQAAAPSYHHASFELGDESAVGEAEKRVAAAGYAIERSIDHASKRSFFVIDPDGLRSEFYVRRSDAFADLSKEPAADRVFLI